MTTPQAHLLHAMPNFRDLGGLPAGPGRVLRRHLLYRAPVPRDLPADDMARLKAMHPGVIIDLRGVAEAAERPQELPEGLAIRRAPHPVEPRTREYAAEIAAGAPLTHAHAHDAMTRSYRGYVEDFGDTFASAVRTALESAADGRPAIFHCTAGKDRTGLTAALILSLVGTPKARIIENYMATNKLWKPDPQLRGHVDEAARSALFTVHPDYMDSAFEALDRLHGGPKAFAEAALGGAERASHIIAAITEPA
ncbi:tyrosine-protein phosphatase [Rhodovulum sp. DZ06]|uniref:tyrosine-protein phosphatase n=1 Tax=Rhodovulum sp. DZ06 TaxID=3425126 RepID=UPI003D328F6F